MTGCNEVQLFDSKNGYKLCGEIQALCYTIGFANIVSFVDYSGAEKVI
jgi:hypothetical protein